LILKHFSDKTLNINTLMTEYLWALCWNESGQPVGFFLTD